MKHVYGFDSVNLLSSCVALGSFDGVHTGHRHVLETLRNAQSPVLSAGDDEGTGPLVVISLEDTSVPFIYSEEEKAIILEKLGVDLMISFPAARMEDMGLEAFMREYVAGCLHCQVFGAGSCFKNIDELRTICRAEGIVLVEVAGVQFQGRLVTAEYVKELGEAGSPDFFTLLGAPYIVAGDVIHGRAAGGKHGMPTANISFHKNRWLPAFGVYAVLVRIDGRPYRSVTNIGPRPSVDANPAVTIEAFLLNYSGDLYGRKLVLEAYLHVRGIIKFAGGFDELRRQIDRDIEIANACLEKFE